jgi:hypothetical protein
MSVLLLDRGSDDVQTKRQGQGLIEWWQTGGRWWSAVLTPSAPAGAQQVVYDLRQMLLLGVTWAGRWSCIPRHLGVSNDGQHRPMIGPRANACATQIGRDLMAWIADEKAGLLKVPALEGPPIEVDARALVLKSLQGWEAELREQGKPLWQPLP